MLLLSRSIRRKILATGLSAAVFTLLYQATVFDSRTASGGDPGATAPFKAGSRVGFEATAYCRGETTASGIAVRAGMAASDPKILPIGSVIQIDRVAARYQGIYSILDTGPEIHGREVDIYMWNCDDAVAFGRQKVIVTVLRRGWVDDETKR